MDDMFAATASAPRTAPTEASRPSTAAPAPCPKRALDQFYTLDEVARACMDDVERELADLEVATWLEPSAGGGAFLKLLPSPRIGLDLDPQHDEVRPYNFFEWHPKGLAEEPIVAVGNPPFGKNASLALRFLNHASSFCEAVCMILPRTFEKDAMKAKVDPRMRLVHSRTLDPASFSRNFIEGPEKRPYSVPCCFQIWRRDRTSGSRAIVRPVLYHHHFDFVDNQDAKPSDAKDRGVDFAFQRVGGRAGLSSVEGLSKSWKSHYWIRANRDFVDPTDLMATLNRLDWTRYKHSTAGNPSIGKGELVAEYASIHPHPSTTPAERSFSF